MKLTVKVVRCSYKRTQTGWVPWYHKHIGEKFEVTDNWKETSSGLEREDTLYKTIDVLFPGLILKTDCVRTDRSDKIKKIFNYQII